MYNVGMFGGEIKMKSRVVHYTDDDIQNLEEKWIPTGTTYVSTEERIRLAALKEKRAREESEELNKKL